MPDGLAVFAFADARAFSQWLAENAGAKGAWLQLARTGAAATISKAEAIDCALCHGWIDGRIQALDAAHFLTRFTPRTPASRWSAKNVERAQALLAQGRMQPAGLAAIEAAKADGRWAAAYPSAARAQTPPDFAAALANNAEAERAFATLDGANRYAILYRLHHARPDARAERIAAFIEMLARGQTLHAPRRARQRGAVSGKTTAS